MRDELQDRRDAKQRCEELAEMGLDVTPAQIIEAWDTIEDALDWLESQGVE